MITYFHRTEGDADSKETILDDSSKVRMLLRKLRKEEYCLGLRATIASLAYYYEHPTVGPANSRPLDLRRVVEEHVAYLAIGSGSKKATGELCTAAIKTIEAYVWGYRTRSDNLVLAMFVLNSEDFIYETSEMKLTPTLYIAVYLAEPGDPDPFKAFDNRESLLRGMSVFPL